jgi:hypothetical protein
MKSKLHLLALMIVLTFSVLSCSTADDETTVPNANVNINTGDLKLFVLDTARVKTISMTGANETTILNKYVNTSSYIGRLSLNSNCSIFVYSEIQGTFAGGSFTSTRAIRIANVNGSGDTQLYSVAAGSGTTSTDIPLLKFGASKVYFITNTQTFVGGAVSNVIKFNSVNTDGSGLVSENFSGTELYNGDLTSDGKYYGTVNSTATVSAIRILDRYGDNGAGSLYFSENSTVNDNLSNLIFSYDDKFAYYSFLENQTLKVKKINMTTKTSEVKTIATGITMPAFSSNLRISVASDNNRGIIVLDQFNSMPTKSYVFNLTAGTSTTFNNNDNTISNIVSF